MRKFIFILSVVFFSLVFSLTLYAQTAPKFISTVDTLTFAGDIFSYNISVTDADGNDLTISCPVKPVWANFTDLGNGKASVWGTPPDWFTDQPLKIDATDGTATTQQSYLIDVHSKVSQQEFDALVAFYNSTNGAGWVNNKGWNTTINNVSSRWHGLAVSPDGKVIAMYMYENNLTGVIPPEIGNMLNITDIDLHQNSIGGTLPKEIGNLSKLLYFQIFANQISGSIPSEIGNLVRLEKLVLSDNNFTGQIPASMGNLVNLEVLSLNNNQLSGAVPTELTLLSRLANLSLAYNEFTSIPNLSTIASLSKLKVEQNRLYFSHLEPNMSILSNVVNSSYRPQKIFTYPVGLTNRFVFNAGESVMLNVSFAGVANRYQWYKDGNASPLTARSSSSSFTFPNLQPSDAGLYYAFTTNNNVPNLSYNSEFITLIYNNPPQFTGTIASVAEEETPYIYNITVSDADATDIISITCTDKPDWLTFTDLGNGKATLTGTPLNQHVGLVNITIKAYDGVVKTPTLQTFALQIKNANDPPTALNFSDNQIVENTPLNTTVGILQTTDSDAGDIFVYNILSGNTDNAFAISNNKLIVNGLLDFESLNIYTLNIRSTDSGSESIENVFIINVLDAPDPPTQLNISGLVLAENILPNGLVASLSTIDQDSHEHTYAFQSAPGKLDDDNGKFYINGNGVYTNHTIDYEKQRKYYITLKTSDAAGNFLINSFIFQVVNVNDEAPAWESTIFSVSIDENTAVGTEYFVQLKAYDPDTLNTVSYSILESPTLAKIDASTAWLTLPLGHKFDYETTQQYIVTVVSTDTKYNSPLQFSFNINDLNELPRFNPISKINLLENAGTQSLVISGIDDGDLLQNQPLTFNIVNSNPSLVYDILLDYTQGESTATLNYTVGGNKGTLVTLGITLKDNGLVNNTFFQSVGIDIRNINTSPSVHVLTNEFETYENEAIAITGINFTDPDVDNGTMKMRLSVRNGLIKLNQINGLIFSIGGQIFTTVECSGTLVDLNAALAAMTYQPTLSFFGNDELSVLISDLGNSGVGGELKASATIKVIVNEILLPRIILQPVAKNQCMGGAAVFSVEAMGYKLNYQWYKDFSKMDGQNSNQLSLKNLTINDIAEYWCQITNPKGTVATNKSKLDVKQLDFNTVVGNVNCADAADGSIEFSPLGGYGVYWFLLNKAGAQMINTNLRAGIYTAEVSDGVCTASKMVEIAQPAPIAIDVKITDLLCFGENTGALSISATGGTNSYIYHIENEAHYAQTLAMPYFNNLKAGNYTLTLTDGKNCKASKQFVISQPNMMFVDFAPTEVVCYGETLKELTAEIGGGLPPYTFSWTNYIQSYSFENVNIGIFTFESASREFPAGTYRINMIDQNGCMFQVFKKIEQAKKLDLNIKQLENEFCAGNGSASIQVEAFGGVGGYLYSFDGAEFQSTGFFDKLNAGTHFITLKDVQNCTQTIPVEIKATHYPPKLDFEMEYVDSYGAVKFFNLSSNADLIMYDFGDGEVTPWWGNQWSPVHVFKTSGSYEVKLIAKNICKTDTISKILFLDFPQMLQTELEAQIELFPNPTSDFISVQLPATLNVSEIRLINSLGQTILQQAVHSNRNFTIDVSKIPMGIFYLQIRVNEQFVSKKIVKI